MKKQDIKIQLHFSEKEYAALHTKAIEFWGTDNRFADAAYIKNALKKEKSRNKADHLKTKSLVEIQEEINILSRNGNSAINSIKGRMNYLWHI